MILRLALAMAILPINFIASYAQGKIATRPNVVIILADDMGYGDVSANNPYARTKTPGIDVCNFVSVLI